MDVTKRFNRIVAIYFQLQAKPVIRAKDLAEQFDVSQRTIYRDIKALEHAGIPIYGEAGTGYGLVEGYRLPPTKFSKEEILTLAAAEKLMQKFVDPDLFRHFSSALNKIKAYLRYNDKLNVTFLEENMLMGSLAHRFNENVPSALSILFESIAQQQMVDMKYRNSLSAGAVHREIEPVGVFHQGNYWYFMAYCHLRKDYRQFRIDRIHQIQLTSTAFTKEHNPLSHYLKKEESIPAVTIRIALPLAYARYTEWERSYYGFVSEEITDSEVIMTFASKNMEQEFARWYLMFADQARILEPDSLKEYVRALLTSIQI
ncbi:helix-turn-helix transcriptional regulator [Sphingobacterium arenae]|uniref:YafY family transcriptional regulator n=1 Tax=Sphingobacterium arenae TaxID=1280598 RepID=A0ABR7Y203_9SPHI|nr:YafY family protein [Sphingobacterium arenae]MBD1425332.1 YafY family transcriptional regulator [Sphingobacterium arenae]